VELEQLILDQVEEEAEELQELQIMLEEQEVQVLL
jgi:hypothetical protein